MRFGRPWVAVRRQQLLSAASCFHWPHLGPAAAGGVVAVLEPCLHWDSHWEDPLAHWTTGSLPWDLLEMEATPKEV